MVTPLNTVQNKPSSFESLPLAHDAECLSPSLNSLAPSFYDLSPSPFLNSILMGSPRIQPSALAESLRDPAHSSGSVFGSPHVNIDPLNFLARASSEEAFYLGSPKVPPFMPLDSELADGQKRSGDQLPMPKTKKLKMKAMNQNSAATDEVKDKRIASLEKENAELVKETNELSAAAWQVIDDLTPITNALREGHRIAESHVHALGSIYDQILELLPPPLLGQLASQQPIPHEINQKLFQIISVGLKQSGDQAKAQADLLWKALNLRSAETQNQGEVNR